MNIFHICAGWQKWNGAANIARLIAKEQEEAGNNVTLATWASIRQLCSADEVWVHCGWLPCLWWAALWGRNIHWMPEACYDPVRIKFHGWKKWLVGPIERFCLRRASRIVATCEAEKGWIQAYLGDRCPAIEVTDIKRFFSLETGCREKGLSDCRIDRLSDCCSRAGDGGGLSDCCSRAGGVTVQSDNQTISQSDNAVRQSDNQTIKQSDNEPLHLLYLGRRHPLKGLEFLEAAISELNSKLQTLNFKLKVVSNAFGDELEKVWEWCDVLVLPTLSDNFGLVIAEALERGKRVITTDGAPAWGDGNSLEFRVKSLEYGGEIWSGCNGRLIYLKGYRDGVPSRRVSLLKTAIQSLTKRN